MKQTVLVFDTNGKLGTRVVIQTLDKGCKIKAFVRNPEKYTRTKGQEVEMVKGDATNITDVKHAMEGADVVVSCLGNPPKKGIYIMEKAHSNIMSAASDSSSSPRCLMISSIGIVGSSWLVKFLLQKIGGKEGFTDFENAEKKVLEKKDVSFVVIRPAGLTDKQGKGKYSLITKPTVFFPKFISRSDVATFFINCISDTSYDGKAIMIEGI